MKLTISVVYGLKDIDKIYNRTIVKPITWVLNKNIESDLKEIEKEVTRCINLVEIPLEDIENTKNFILQFNTDLQIENKKLLLGGCRMSGATIHASSLKFKDINKLFKKQLVEQILNTIIKIKNKKIN